MSEKEPEPQVPQRIGRYEIQKMIGRGMMGVVYQAHDSVLRRAVALKTISIAWKDTEHARATFEKHFLEEARAAAALSHPGIVVVYDFGSDPETRMLYFAMEYLRGKTLASILAEGLPLDWRETLGTVRSIAEALHYAHEHGVVHRDIKPANIMVLGSGQPKIMDFGVAKMESSPLSTGAMVVGTPSYMSPEQAQAQAVDRRTDIFSLGAVLYELLTSRRAFSGANVRAVLLRLAYEDPIPPSRLVPGLPAEVDAIVAHALAKSRDERYASSKALAEDIDDILGSRGLRHACGYARSADPTTISMKARSLADAPLPGVDAPPAAPKTGKDTDRAGSGSRLSLPEGKRISLAVLDGEPRGGMFVIDRPRTVIGRAGGAAGADIELTDPEMSRSHAVLECYGQQVVLRDLGSTNGTFVDSQRVTEATLEDRSEFRVGRTSLMLIVTDKE